MKTSRSQILVLGSEGTIGTALCTLLEKYYYYNVTHYDISITPEHDLRISAPDMSNYDFIFFLAYDIGGSKYLLEQQTDFIDNNIKIMLNVFEQLRSSKKPFIFASSQMQNMDNPYGTLKKLGEHYTALLGGISLRFWNVYGPEEIGIKSHVITDFIHQYKETGHIKLMTNGSEQRQFLHADDCANGLICIMGLQLSNSLPTNCKVVDLTNFEWTSIKELAIMITGSESNITLGTEGDKVQTLKNEPNQFILKYWRPEISLRDGIQCLMDSSPSTMSESTINESDLDQTSQSSNE